MANNPYVNKVQLADGTSLIDISSSTVTADKLMQGYTAYDRTGALITGTATGGIDGDNLGYGILASNVVGYAVVGTAVLGSENMVGTTTVGSAIVGG